ncbi:hypothetical protein V2O64_11555 [Verrucomicrobiaceae bacterium 227]
MKIRRLAVTHRFSLLVLGLTSCNAFSAVISVDGFLEEGPGRRGATLDFFDFEVLTSGEIRIEAPVNLNFEHFLSQRIVGSDEFIRLDEHPYILSVSFCGGLPLCSVIDSSFVLNRYLDAGRYVITTSASTEGDWDLNQGYLAFSGDVGAFEPSAYNYTITGDVNGLRQLEGQLDGRFSVTNIPEPATSVFVVCGLVISLCFRVLPMTPKS